MGQLSESLDGMNTHLRRFVKILTRTSELRVEISEMLALLGSDLSDAYNEKVMAVLIRLAETQEDQTDTLLDLQVDVRKIVEGMDEFTAIMKDFEQRVKNHSRATIKKIDTDTEPKSE